MEKLISSQSVKSTPYVCALANKVVVSFNSEKQLSLDYCINYSHYLQNIVWLHFTTLNPKPPNKPFNFPRKSDNSNNKPAQIMQEDHRPYMFSNLLNE